MEVSKMIKRIFVILALVMILPLTASATLIVTSAYYDGSRIEDKNSTGDTLDGITSNGPWDYPGGFEIYWSIDDPDSSGWWTYEYRVFVPIPSSGQRKTISHWILEISAGATAADFKDFYPTEVEDFPPLSGWPPSASTGQNPNMPGYLYGYKFSPTPTTNLDFTVTFKSTKKPIWGDFYAKDGNQSQAWNTGFGIEPMPGDDPIRWIPTPDTNGGGGGEETIPEPSTLILLGSGLVGLASYMRARFRRKE
jgi:hypothetical protein